MNIFPPLVAVTSGKNETISFGIKELIETFQIGFLGWVPFYNSAARLFCDPLSRKATSSATQGVGTRRASGELRIDASFHQNGTRFGWAPGRFFTGIWWSKLYLACAIAVWLRPRCLRQDGSDLIREPSHGSFLRYPRTPEPFRPQH